MLARPRIDPRGPGAAEGPVPGPGREANRLVRQVERQQGQPSRDRLECRVALSARPSIGRRLAAAARRPSIEADLVARDVRAAAAPGSSRAAGTGRGRARRSMSTTAASNSPGEAAARRTRPAARPQGGVGCRGPPVARRPARRPRRCGLASASTVTTSMRSGSFAPVGCQAPPTFASSRRR